MTDPVKAEKKSQEQSEAPDTLQAPGYVAVFTKETIILVLGISIGFLWSTYLRQRGEEANLVVALGIVILCLLRLIYFMYADKYPSPPNQS